MSRTSHAAFSRQDANDWPPNGWRLEREMFRDEAPRSITPRPAYPAFRELLVGRKPVYERKAAVP